MDETTVRGLLKEQQDRVETLAQQQAATFQLQFEALHAELLATLGQLQGRPGGGGDTRTLLPRSMHLDVPKFSREDPDRCGCGMVSVDDKEWFDYRLGSLLVSKPTTLGDAFALARITEARLDGQVAALPSTPAKTVAAVTSQRQAMPRLGGVSGTTNTSKPPVLPNPTGTSKPLAIKWISPAERQERLNKGSCFNCDNRWTRGHKCPGKFLLLMTEEEEDMEVATGEGEGDVAMMDHDNIYGIYEIHHLANEFEVEEMPPETGVPRLAELEQLLLRFDSIFQFEE
ncbi:hypothetical protein CTI12_AA342280 [Artemisia annua]|uniref:Uncharacterized protein n=1 Tax=Artemisia annua TaxID=35608 RepID=A0A2U1MTV8_ARTAN|nr:hypothetical protein CTI12_AA342280 [Artemisia annua]